MKSLFTIGLLFCTNFLFAQRSQKLAYYPNSVLKINTPQNLNGDTLFLPNHVTLNFSNNGYYYNGVIKGQNTKIIANFGKSFFSNTNCIFILIERY